MAVTATQTVVHIPFPVRVQRQSLEPDGLAYARLQSTGDGSGGNVLHTFRGQAGNLYILRGISLERDLVGVGPGRDVEIRLDAQWLADSTGLVQGDFFTVMTMAEAQAAAAPVRAISTPNFINGLLELARILPLGTITRGGVFDILSASHRTNILNDVYTTVLLFDVYRTEAFTVPGILNQLRVGLIR